jgi:glycosyltransferase involved in cell wall biosynthesis
MDSGGVKREPGKRHRIVYILPVLETGGAQRQLRELLLALDRSRFDPLLVGFDGPDSDYVPHLEATGTPVVLLAKKAGFDPLAVFRLARFLRRTRPAIIHALNSSGNRYGVTAAVLAGVPGRITTELNYFQWERSRRHDLLDRIVGRFTDRVVANSHFVKEVFGRATSIPPEKIEVIYNGYRVDRYEAASRDDGARRDKRRELGLRDDRIAFGIIARLATVKNHRMLLRASRLLNESGHAHQVLVAGDGPERAGLESLAGELGVSGNVAFLGNRSDPLAVTGALDVTLLTSTTESLSNAIIESLLAARPVIATAVGGNPELITDGRNGFLIPSDDAEALAARMRQLIEDPKLIRKLGATARDDAVKTFSAERMIRLTEGLYDKILQSH